MNYIIDEKIFETEHEAAEYIAENIDSETIGEMVDEMLDDGGDVEICGLTYSASLCLKRVDPIAYRCALSDYRDLIYSDVLYDLEGLADGDRLDCYGFEIEADAGSIPF